MIKYPLNIAVLVSAILLGGLSAHAQTPLNELHSQARHAVVIVTAYDQQNRELRQGLGFFIAPNRVVTNFSVVDFATRVRILTINRQLVPTQIKMVDQSADVAILQINESCQNVTTLPVRTIETVSGSALVSEGNEVQWRVTTDQPEKKLSFVHLASGMQITAVLSLSSNGETVVTFKANAIGQAVRTS